MSRNCSALPEGGQTNPAAAKYFWINGSEVQQHRGTIQSVGLSHIVWISRFATPSLADPAEIGTDDSGLLRTNNAPVIEAERTMVHISTHQTGENQLDYAYV